MIPSPPLATEQYQAGNTIDLLQNGNEIFPAMLEAIRGARASIEFSTYVYWHSRIAIKMALALCERARAGVTVRLLIDAVGGATMSTRMIGQLERAGVQVAWFRPVRPGHLQKVNHRTHRKILLIDGNIGFTGGVGIADQWDGNAQDKKHWRETHCRVKGPVCADLFAGFASNWLEATGQSLAVVPRSAPAGSTPALVTASTVGPRPTTMEQLFAKAIVASRQRLWITTAYFIPDSSFVELLIAAAARGVDVRVITNGPSTNHKLTRRAGQATYDTLIEGGVKIYEYQRTVLHVKAMTVDRSWGMLGSANFDNRSLVLNDELNLSFIDPKLVSQLDAQFWLDLNASQHMRMALWQKRPWHHRLLIASSRLLSRQL